MQASGGIVICKKISWLLYLMEYTLMQVAALLEYFNHFSESLQQHCKEVLRCKILPAC